MTSGQLATGPVIPWLHSLPRGWRALKLKYAARVRPSNVDKKSVEGERAVRLCNYVDVYKNEAIRADMRLMEATATEGQIRAFALRAGDVIVTKDSEDWRDIAVPAFVPESLPDVVCGYHLALVRPDSRVMDGRFLFRAFSASGVNDQFRYSATGITRYGLSVYDLGSALFPVPPLDDQRKIADFLEDKTAAIDQLIADKWRMIELLHEKRRAVVNEAITQGIDPTAPRKSSGAEWIAAIPAHWQLEPLRHSITRIEQGWSPQCENRQAEDGEWGVLKVGCVNGDRFDPTEQKALPLGVDPLSEYEIGAGDILMSRGNTRELVGLAALVDTVRPRLLLCDLLYRFRARPGKLEPEFLVHALRSQYVRYQIEREARGSSPSMKKIGQENIRELLLCVPPLVEQRAIINRLRPSLAAIDGIEATIQQQIVKLREYRQTVISAAVTGQLALVDSDGVRPIEVQQPGPKANPYFQRAVFAAEIVSQLGDEPTFGHVKFQKCYFVAVHDLGIDVFDDNFARQAAGPHDNQMIRSVDSQMAKQKWFRAEKVRDGYVYRRLEKAGQHKKYFDRYFGDKAARLDELLALFRPMRTEQAEIVATLYAAWNDFLIRGEPADDDKIVAEVLTNWAETKERIGEDRWRKALAWMREKGLVPRGFGKPTRPAGSN